MHHVSIVHTDSSLLQEAIDNKAHKDVIVKLKSSLAFNCVTGFESYIKPFAELGILLSSDVGFIPFKLKTAERALYNTEKHPNATGGIRGVNNIDSMCSWLCYDIDDSTITDKEMHRILGSINHHIARTSDRKNPYKMRIMVELSKPVVVTRDEWTPFISSIASSLGLPKIDKLTQSHVTFGYTNREVLSVLTGNTINPSAHLNIARMKVSEIAEKKALQYASPAECSAALANPYTTFGFAYNASVGNRWATGHAAIHKAKDLGASREYIVDLLYSINDFLDNPKPRSVVEATQISAI